MTTPKRSIEVVAGVITDPRGRVLLTRRTAGRDQAGLWEFPGGKREPGETPEEALERELKEELGIEAVAGARIIDVPQEYPDKFLRLDVRHIVSWTGTPRGREGQAMAWVERDKLGRYRMPPADRPVVAALKLPDTYLITPAPGASSDAAWLAALAAALGQGIRRVQLRAPGEPADRWRSIVERAAALCKKAKAEVLVSHDVELARENYIGVHLSAAQLRDAAERPLPAGQLVAASCHDADDARVAEALECDFVVLGPVRETASHPGQPGVGWGAFEAVREQVSLPIYALGGMGPGDVAEARDHGAQGVAGIRAFWPAAPKG